MEFVAGYTREFLLDYDVLRDELRRIIYGYDTQEKPICKIEEEYCHDLDFIENFWIVPAIFDSRDSTNINLENSIPSTAMKTSVIKTHESIRFVAANSL